MRSISASKSLLCSRGPGLQFIGEIDEQQKSDFLGQASALMFLINWPEPFGLSMIEEVGLRHAQLLADAAVRSRK